MVREGDITNGLRVALPGALRSVTTPSDTPALLISVIMNFETGSIDSDPGRMKYPNVTGGLVVVPLTATETVCAGHNPTYPITMVLVFGSPRALNNRGFLHKKLRPS